MFFGIDLNRQEDRIGFRRGALCQVRDEARIGRQLNSAFAFIWYRRAVSATDTSRSKLFATIWRLGAAA